MKEFNVALLGNPNSGKTTLFNSLAGTNYHVANYPGITVERKHASIKYNNKFFTLHDLPGTYSLSSYSIEESVTRDFLLNKKPPDLTVQVIDASNLVRNLYLTIQLLEIDTPLIIALNMIDVAEKRSIKINIDKLSKNLGIIIVPVIARTGFGKEELLKAISNYEYKASNVSILNISYGNDIDDYLQKASNIIGYEQKNARWLALKYLENDENIIKNYSAKTYHNKLLKEVKGLETHIKNTLDTYPEGLIADFRYGVVKNITQDVLSDNNQLNRLNTSDLIDKVLTQRLLGPMILLSLLYFIFKLIFLISDYPIAILDNIFLNIKTFFDSILNDGLLKSLILSGIIDGVGGVLSFTPLIFFLFFIIAILEDSGYMARMAYMLDRVFKFFGLHGTSVVPFIISGGIAGGCAVPGVMAARTIKGAKEKILTILTAPFMACGAKIPVFALLISAFFPWDKGLGMFLITISSWLFALLIAKLYSFTIIKAENSCFIMELPPYRFPTLKGLFLHAWERTWLYIKKAGTIILGISVLLWVLMTFPTLNKEEIENFDSKILNIKSLYNAETLNEINTITDESILKPEAKQLKNELSNIYNIKAEFALKKSIAGRIGLSIEKISKYAGFDRRINIALLGGFAAKEVVVSTLGTAFSLGEVDAEDTNSLSSKLQSDDKWNKAVALALILFTILYAPCFVTVIAIIKETSSYKWGLFSVISNTLIAYIFAVLAYQIFK